MTGERPQLRPVEAADRDFMEKMAYEAAIAGFRTPPTFEEAVSQGQLNKYFEDWGRPHDDGFVAVENGGREVGAAWYRLFPDRYRVLGEGRSYTPEVIMAVAPASRAQGIGKELLETLMGHAHAQGLARLRLNVLKANQAALRLYESVGFISRGEISLQYGTEASMALKMFARLGVY